MITNTYLSRTEYNLLASLPAAVLSKTRFSVPLLGIDVFDPPLHGLILAEAEFATDEAALSRVTATAAPGYRQILRRPADRCQQAPHVRDKPPPHRNNRREDRSDGGSPGAGRRAQGRAADPTYRRQKAPGRHRSARRRRPVRPRCCGRR
jgi:hypothetical protein